VTGIDTDGLAFGPNGNLYAAHVINSSSNGSVYEVSPAGVVSTFASALSGPTGLAFDSSGNLYVGEGQGNDVRKITPNGVASIFATGISGATGLAFDSSGNLYVASQFGGYVDKITPGGVVSTFATGFASPVGVAFDSSGNLYVANNTGGSISKVTPGSVISTFATGLNSPSYPAFDSSGNLYVTEYYSGNLMKVGPGGGTPTLFASGFTGGEAIVIVPSSTTTTLTSDHPGGSVYGQPVTFTATVSAATGTPTGSVQFQIDGANFGAAVPLNNGTAQISIATLSASPHNITAAYTSNSSSFLNSSTASPLVQTVTSPIGFTPGDLYVSARLGSISLGQVAPNGAVTSLLSGADLVGLAFSPSGKLYVSSPVSGQIFQADSQGNLTLFATLPAMYTAGISGMAFDSNGNMYMSDWYINGIYEITPAGVVSTYATGITTPDGLAFGSSGNLYVASEQGNFVDKITPGGVVSTFATGFSTPVGVAFDSSGNLYVANSSSDSISKVTPEGVVSTFATGFSGRPEYPAFDSSGNLYVPEYDTGTISVVGPGGGTGTLFATGFAGTESLAFFPPTLPPTPIPTTSTTTLSSDHPGGSVYGQPVTFTANVSAASGTPTGSVDFFDTTTNTNLGTVPLPVAPTYDANADFEAGWAAGTNPNGVWSYGRTIDISGPLVLFTRHYIPPVNNNLEQMWDDPNDSSGATPSVALNSGGAFNDGNVTFQAGALIMHPCGVSGHDYAHVIFTAPATGSYSLAGDFFAQQNGIDVDVHVLVNGVSVFDSTITSNGVSRPFSGTFSLSAGDTIDFAVGPNGNFVQHQGNTGLSATITPSSKGAVLVTSSLGAGTHDITATYTSNSSSFLNSSTASPFVQIVSPAPLTVTAADASRLYGNLNPAFTGTVIGIQNNDPIGATYSTTATPSSNVSTYAIVPTLIDPNNRLGNYTVTVRDGTLTVNPAPLAVTAADATRTYGSANRTFTGTIVGIKNNDDITAVYSTAAAQASDVGTYDITPTLTDPDGRLGNYTVTIHNGTLSITPAHLTVTANDLTLLYGDPNPALSYTITGFVLGQTLTTSGVTGAPELNTTYTGGSPVGTYLITVSQGTLAAKNYYFTTFVPGTLTVTYGIKVLFDHGQARQCGSTIPVEIQLTDYYGNVVSSAGVGVQALYVVPASNPGTQLPVGSPGNAQPGNDFRFTGGRYRYNLDTTGLADGTYTLYFTVDGDPLVHSVSFVVG
jgi:sugar lactone lactonase YvrE